MRRHYTKFTEAEVRLIIDWRSDNVSPVEIAKRLNCGVDRIKDKLAALRIEKSAKRTPRMCLGGCGKLFPSAGAHNRICPSCSAMDRRGAGRFTTEHRVAR